MRRNTDRVRRRSERATDSSTNPTQPNPTRNNNNNNDNDARHHHGRTRSD